MEARSGFSEPLGRYKFDCTASEVDLRRLIIQYGGDPALNEKMTSGDAFLVLHITAEIFTAFIQRRRAIQAARAAERPVPDEVAALKKQIADLTAERLKVLGKYFTVADPAESREPASAAS